MSEMLEVEILPIIQNYYHTDTVTCKKKPNQLANTVGKTEVMKINTKSKELITLGGINIEEVYSSRVCVSRKQDHYRCGLNG